METTLNEKTKLQINVSKEADAEFMRLLKTEDPGRYARLMKNIRKDDPGVNMSEDQALTNFMLGLPTGGFRFRVIAGSPAPEPINPAPKDGHRQAGRPKLRLSKTAKKARRRAQVLEAVHRNRGAVPVIKNTPVSA